MGKLLSYPNPATDNRWLVLRTKTNHYPIVGCFWGLVEVKELCWPHERGWYLAFHRLTYSTSTQYGPTVYEVYGRVGGPNSLANPKPKLVNLTDVVSVALLTSWHKDRSKTRDPAVEDDMAHGRRRSLKLVEVPRMTFTRQRVR